MISYSLGHRLSRIPRVLSSYHTGTPKIVLSDVFGKKSDNNELFGFRDKQEKIEIEDTDIC